MTYTLDSLTGSHYIDGVLVKEPDSLYTVVDDNGVTRTVLVPNGTEDVEAFITQKLGG